MDGATFGRAIDTLNTTMRNDIVVFPAYCDVRATIQYDSRLESKYYHIRVCVPRGNSERYHVKISVYNESAMLSRNG